MSEANVTNLSTFQLFNLSTKEMLDSQPERLGMTERTHCHCEPRSGAAIQYLFQTNKILKQVQDDAIRIFRNELFNPSTFQPFNQNNKLESEV